MVSFMNGELTLVLKWNIKFCDEGAKILLIRIFPFLKAYLETVEHLFTFQIQA